MKSRYFGVAPLIFASIALASCGGTTAGRAEFVEVCQEKMSGGAERCDCFADSIQANISEDEFASLAQGVHDQRSLSGDWIPGAARANKATGKAIMEATTACF